MNDDVSDYIDQMNKATTIADSDSWYDRAINLSKGIKSRCEVRETVLQAAKERALNSQK